MTAPINMIFSSDQLAVILAKEAQKAGLVVEGQLVRAEVSANFSWHVFNGVQIKLTVIE